MAAVAAPSAPVSLSQSDAEEMKYGSGDGDSADEDGHRRLSIRDLTTVVQALPKWSPQTVFEVFLRRLEVQLMAFDVPSSDWFRVLVLLFVHEINAQEWIRTNVVEAGFSWTDAKPLLVAHFESADYHEELNHQYQSCRQSPSETAQAYGDRFRYLCDQLGYADDNEVVINQFVQRLHPRLYADFLKLKSDMGIQHPGWKLTSLHDAVKLCIKLDVKNRTVQHAMSSSSSSSASLSFSPSSASGWSAAGRFRHTPNGRFTKRIKLSCKYHPHSSNHSTQECRNPTVTPRPTPSASSSFGVRGRFHPAFRGAPIRSQPGPVTAFATSTRTSDLTCYACGGKGHYANDPICPKRRTAGSGPVSASAASSSYAVSSSSSSNAANRPAAALASSSGMMNANNAARPQTFRPSVRALRAARVQAGATPFTQGHAMSMESAPTLRHRGTKRAPPTSHGDLQLNESSDQ